MTARRVRDLYRLLVVEAEPYGVAVRAATWRCDRYVRAEARRALKSLTIRTDMKGTIHVKS